MIPCFSLAMLVLTVWVGAHPVRHELGIMNPNACTERAVELFQHRKNKKLHMEISCEPTDQRRT